MLLSRSEQLLYLRMDYKENRAARGASSEARAALLKDVYLEHTTTVYK